MFLDGHILDDATGAGLAQHQNWSPAEAGDGLPRQRLRVRGALSVSRQLEADVCAQHTCATRRMADSHLTTVRITLGRAVVQERPETLQVQRFADSGLRQGLPPLALRQGPPPVALQLPPLAQRPVPPLALRLSGFGLEVRAELYRL